MIAIKKIEAEVEAKTTGVRIVNEEKIKIEAEVEAKMTGVRTENE